MKRFNGLPKDCMLFGFAEKLTDEQKDYVNSILTKRLTFVNARSGTGKTTLAVACAKLLDAPLVYIFAPVEEDKMGFRKGTQEDKELAYLVPLKDALEEIGENPEKVIYSENNLENAKNGNVWVYPKPHVFARGTNIKKSVVIIGEAQNFTKSELKKVLTRIHDDCVVIVEGHTGQCDLKVPELSGFKPYIDHLGKKHYANVCELNWNFRGELANDADELI